MVGDVTDKGVPAALVMAATRSVLRASAQRLIEPGEVLERVNELLCPDMPEKMFVTCLYGVLDPATGHLRFANAGHDLPYVQTAEGVVELRRRGMPLGLMPGMTYEEKEAVLEPGDSVLLHSDGVVEAHDPARDVRLPAPQGDDGRDARRQRADRPACSRDLAAFTGPTPSRRTTSRWSRSSARPGAAAASRAGDPTDACSPSSSCRASRATSARRWTRVASAVAARPRAPAAPRAAQDRGRPRRR